MSDKCKTICLHLKGESLVIREKMASNSNFIFLMTVFIVSYIDYICSSTRGSTDVTDVQKQKQKSIFFLFLVDFDSKGGKETKIFYESQGLNSFYCLK